MDRHRLKIIIIGPGYPLRGGPALLNENLCLELNKAGHEAQIVSFSFQYPSFLFPGSEQYDTSRQKPPIVIHSVLHTLNPFSWMRVARFIKHQQPDVVLIRYWLPYFAPSLGTIARLIRKHTKVFAIADNIIPHEKRPGDKILTNYFIKPLNGIVCMSQKVEHDLKILFPEKKYIRVYHPLYEVYPPAVDMKTAREELGLPPNKTILLFFGLIRKYKGLDILLQAMEKIKARYPEVVLLVAGDFYEDRKNYEPLLTELINEGRLILHGQFIPDSRIHYYFCAANVCVQPYRNATNSGVSMVSYFYGLPVIATRVGGLPEIIPHGQCGLLSDAEPDAIANAIDQYLTNSLEKEFRKNIVEFRKNFQWDSFVQKVLDFVQSA